MNILVPTRNNVSALASMLGSLLAVTHKSMGNSLGRHDLFLMDSSSEPVIAHPHLGRLLTRFNLFYLHFNVGQVNMQRLAGMRLVSNPEQAVLITDDDHVFVEDPTLAYNDFNAQKEAKAYFGICVDILNDKGYPDFQTHSIAGGHHSFPEGAVFSGTRVDPNLKKFSANPGLLITRPSIAIPLLSALHYDFADAPAVADDAWAKLLADPPLLHGSLQAMHVGNSNKNWSQHAIKHAAVRLAAEGAHPRNQ